MGALSQIPLKVALIVSFVNDDDSFFMLVVLFIFCVGMQSCIIMIYLSLLSNGK